MSAGPAVIDIAGLALTDEDRIRLRHPATGGVILFARNYRDPAQLRALTTEMRAQRAELLLCVDHEGGRVQRFRSGFTSVPPMRRLGECWDRDPDSGRRAARAAGLVIAAELADCGLDFSFTPVLALDYGASSVIGDRAFHTNPAVVGELSAEFIRGLADGGMAAVGKHFPGHGYVSADSHIDLPRDGRSLEEILARDVAPYRLAIEAGLAAVMPAHVVYTAVDPEAAGYSEFWLKEVLRHRLGFDGLIFSDDLSMEGARAAGGIADRARLALAAGCDMVLLCNDPRGQEDLLEGLSATDPASAVRTARMRVKPVNLLGSVAYRHAAELVGALA